MTRVAREELCARPPRIAIWLVNLFSSKAHAESLLGDLHEEFSEAVSQLGLATARRWFWRHSLKSIAHLIAAGFRGAPGSLAGAVLLGFLLRVGLSNPEGIVVAVLRTQRPYSNLHYDFYVWMVTWGIPIVGVLESLSIGCVVAAVARGREIVATMTMSVAAAGFVALSFFLLQRQLPSPMPAPWPVLALNFENCVAIALGGVLVRKIRSVSAHKLSAP
jgi:hypothetical protein